MKGFHYVYMMESVKYPKRIYVGSSKALESRLTKHNHGEVPYTSKFKPWRIKTAVAFSNPKRAMAFEMYLKTASGRSFAKKHF